MKDQIRNVTDTWLKCIGGSVIGIYLHGSMEISDSLPIYYSDYWTEHYKNLLNCIYGIPIKDVFPTIPEDDFWSSISNDITTYDCYDRIIYVHY